MIQKKKFSDAIEANISVVEGLLPVADKTKNGLMPAILAEYTTRIRIPDAENDEFIKILQVGDANFTSNLYMVVGSSNYRSPEIIFLLLRGVDSIGFYRASGRLKFYKDGSGGVYMKCIRYCHLSLVTLNIYNQNTDTNTFPMEKVSISESELTELISSNV